jgi:hypothetical protein
MVGREMRAAAGFAPSIPMDRDCEASIKRLCELPWALRDALGSEPACAP